MKAGFYQFSPVFGKPQENLEKITNILLNCSADIVVIPELALSGYLFINKKEVQKLAYQLPCKISDTLADIAVKKEIAIIIGFAELEKNVVYNSALLITPAGEIKIYRKNHLFHEENLFFTKGNLGFPVFDVKGVKIGILICFDHMFPEAARTLALKGAQIICHPSNLVIPEKAQIITRTRSMENRVFWILANRTGKEERGGKSLTYTGKSQIIDPNGKILIQADEFEEGFFYVNIDPALALDKNVTELCSVFGSRRVSAYEL